jgi:hypothetical protein
MGTRFVARIPETRGSRVENFFEQAVALLQKYMPPGENLSMVRTHQAAQTNGKTNRFSKCLYDIRNKTKKVPSICQAECNAAVCGLERLFFQ